jgi:NADH-quinone oxidoreductase subunit C
MVTLKQLEKHIKKCLGAVLDPPIGKGALTFTHAFGELTIEVPVEQIKAVCPALRDDEQCQFTQLIDLCGVDYSEIDQFSVDKWEQPRFGVVYHLMSMEFNIRLRVKTYLDGEPPILDSVIDVWPAANWFEREAFDLFGVVFRDHPDLRRLLTDYGFIGHPFRKDFPLEGHVEMRYDEEKGRVIYQPVTIEPRTLVPRSAGTDKV